MAASQDSLDGWRHPSVGWLQKRESRTPAITWCPLGMLRFGVKVRILPAKHRLRLGA